MVAGSFLHAEKRAERSLPFLTKLPLKRSNSFIWEFGNLRISEFLLTFQSASWPQASGQIIKSSNEMGSFSFPKSERLYKKKAIQELFDKGSSFYLYPFRVYFQKCPEPDSGHQVMFSVSKRNFNKATDRNLIKRRMREAYRLNKAAVLGISKLQMAYIYTAKEILTFDLIRDKILLSFKRFEEKWEEELNGSYR